jgi:adenine C2-methylase RlmN of 23S rRNA A2503 and tRNA A37
MGLKKNLSADEIISQVLYFSQKLQKEEGQKVNNIVFMGM